MTFLKRLWNIPQAWRMSDGLIFSASGQPVSFKSRVFMLVFGHILSFRTACWLIKLFNIRPVVVTFKQS